MGLGGHRPAHHWCIAMVHQPPCEIHCPTGSQTGKNVGRCHGTARRNDEVDGRFLQQGE